MSGILIYRINNPDSAREDILNVLKNQVCLGMDYIYCVKIRKDEVGEFEGNATKKLKSIPFKYFQEGDVGIIRHSAYKYTPVYIDSKELQLDNRFTTKSVDEIIINLLTQTRLKNLNFENPASLLNDIYIKLSRNSDEIKFIFGMPMYLVTMNGNIFLTQHMLSNVYSKSLEHTVGTIKYNKGILNIKK